DEACQRATHCGKETHEGGPFDTTPQTTSSILTADFNFPPEHPSYEEIQHSLAGGCPPYRDAWRIVNGRKPHTPTFCVFDERYAKTPYACDFVFVSDDLSKRVRSVTVNSETQA